MQLVINGSEGKGNQKIRIEYAPDGTYQLRFFNLIIPIKIPNSHQKTFTLENFNKQTVRISYNKKGKLVLNITYSYIRPIKHFDTRGTVGIDIGPKEIAVCYVKKDGNPACYKHYSIGNLLDKRSEDTQRELSLILDEIISDAAEAGFHHFTIENLNFKDNYKFRSKRLNRMLKKFPYAMFDTLMQSKANRKGFVLKRVNPAYTSVIGIFKYSDRDNLSTSHNAKSKDLSAALVIGRRGLGFNERAVVSVRVSGRRYSLSIKSLLAESEKEVMSSTGTQETAFGKLDRSTNTNSNWSLWSKLKKKFDSFKRLTAELSAHPPDGLRGSRIVGYAPATG